LIAEAQFEALPLHAGDDIAQPVPRVHVEVEQLGLRLARFEGEEAEGSAEQGMAGNYRSPAAKACSWMKRHPAKAAAPSSSESPALEERGEFPTMT
jgi:hypothetical protein